MQAGKKQRKEQTIKVKLGSQQFVQLLRAERETRIRSNSYCSKASPVWDVQTSLGSSLRQATTQ